MIGTPPLREPPGDRWTIGWANWFSQAFLACVSVQQSGTTANRPTEDLWVGRIYYDTTLAKPIWYKGPGWILADGTAA